jgi:polar amino acid transport system substrate-binding protein
MKKSLVGFLILGLIGVFLYMKWKSPQVTMEIPETLIVGTSADFQPFCFKDKDAVVGFDIDIAREVARRLGKEVVIKDIPFELLIPQLQLGSVHFVASCMTPTPERAQRVIFSEPYLTGDRLIVISTTSNPIKTLAELKGKKVIVNQGYTADRYMSKIEGIDLVRLPSVSEAMLALNGGRADAFVTASKPIQPYFDQYGRSRFSTFFIDDATEDAALAFSSLYPKLAQEVETILQSMKSDGTIEQLKAKWRLL